MGTWGPGNLENDYVGDELGDRTHKLMESLLERARNKLSRDEGEYEHTALIVDFEILFALDANGLLYCNNLPAVEDVEQLKRDFIREWDVHIEGYDPKPEYKQGRRQVILRTFDRLKKICSRRAKEQQVSTVAEIEYLEITPPSLEELVAGAALTTHSVCGDYEMALPVNWSTHTSNELSTPDYLLAKHFWEHGSTFTANVKVLDDASKDYGKLVEQPFLLEDVFFATGRSLLPDEVPESADPYILIAKLSSADGNAPGLYDLVYGTAEALSPSYEGEGCFVDEGPYEKEENDELEFLGMHAWKPSEHSSNEKLKLFQSVYFHVISEDSIVLLEVGSLGEEPDSFELSVSVGSQPDPSLTKYMSDPALVEHLTDTLRLR